MVCSTVTNIIACIAGHSNIGYIQMVLSVSPQHQNQVEFFHSISSSSVFNKATIAMMKAFNWHRVGLVHDSLGFYFLNTANDFVHQLQQSYPSSEIVTRVQITNSQTIIREIFKNINDQEVRIGYWVVSRDQGAFSLCEAYNRKFLWPGYIFILRFLDLDSVLQASKKTACTGDEIRLVLVQEGVFLLEYRLFVNNSTQLYSGWSYGEFRQRYKRKLYAEKRSDPAEENVYANSLYDQVWAYALAINHSLATITSKCLLLEDYRIGNTKSISEIIKSELKKLSFQGASGRIDFNELQEVPSFIDILFQIHNQTRVLIGTYDPFTKNVTFTKHMSGYVPDDTFEIIYNLLPSWLGGCILTAQITLFCTVTVNMVLLLCWKQEKDVTILSTLIMIGCYLLCIASVLLIVQRMTVIKNTTLLLSMCNINIWFSSIGLDLILATLFLRLLRVYHIFKMMATIKKHWFDEYLFIYALLICTGKVCLLIIWSVIDLIYPETLREYVPTAMPPYYRAILYCTSNSLGLWLLLSFLYSRALLLLVLFLAIQTCHIQRYKD